MAVRYQAVRWLHDFDDEPVVLYSEIDDDGWEHRKVDEFRDGRLVFADEEVETETTRIGTVPAPSLAEINADPAFNGRVITAEDFEAIWERARRM